MKRLRQFLAENEEWLKRRIQEYSARLECGDDSEELWSLFFTALKATAEGQDDAPAPETPTDRSRLHTLFLSLKTPVMLLDVDLNVEVMNPAAVELLDKGGDLAAWGGGSHAPVPVHSLAPWLVETLQGDCVRNGEQVACRLDVSVEQQLGERHFNVSMSLLSDYSDRHDGYAVVLDDISYRVESERQLARERNRAAHYLNVVGALVFALDASGAVTMVNRTGCGVLGYGEFELLGRDWIETLVPPEQRDEVRDYFYLVNSGQADETEERYHYVTDKEGAHRLVRWQNKLLTNEGGLPVGMLISGIDVTEQRAIEDALAEKELWLRNTFVALGEAVLILTPDMRILDANPAAEAMFQMPNEELDGLPVAELHVDSLHYQDFLDQSEAAFNTGEQALFELPLKRRDGEIFPADHSVSLINGDDGTTLGVVNVFRDISDRKQAELELRRSEEKFRRIFETIEEGYMVTDLDGIIQMVNPATCRLLQYEEAELVGQDIATLYFSTDERFGFKRILAERGALRGQQMSAKRKDGVQIVIEANAHLVMDDSGSPVAMEGTFRDITRRIEAEKAIRESEKQYRAFFENNHAIMLLTDPKTEQIIDANPAAGEFYGYSPDVMRTMNMDQINTLTQAELFQEMQKSREEGRSYFVVKHTLASSEIRDVEVYSGPIMVQGVQRLYSVIHDVTKRIELEQEMKHLATTDTLTGVNNRHQFFSLGNRELERTKRYESSLSVFMLDIDYFKSINDTYGHHAGDQVLKTLSATALTILRDSDVFGRLGGEEFAAFLPETGLAEAMEVAERLRHAFGDLTVVVEEAEIRFTVSIGVTQVTGSERSIEDIVNRADEALYRAKRMGRNRVVRG